MHICVFLSAADLDARYTTPAREFAAALGAAGHTLVWGGSNTGLMKVIAEYPHELRLAVAARAPHRLTTMVRDLATAFHHFYTNCKVLDPEQPELSSARMGLVRAARQLLANELHMLGLAAPERM